jgi:hypothetical protein
VVQSRRVFLQTALAATALPATGWATVGMPTHLTAARTTLGAYVLVGLREDGSCAFTLPLSARGHAAAAHPTLAQAVAFARRPGTYAVVIDCAEGRVQQHLEAPSGHHFYGHGAYSSDGKTLFTTENHIASGEGRIGLWDAANAYTRLDDFSSGGIGPHEMLRMPGCDTLAVANGGIRTHPDRARDKLNLDTMRSNLTIMNAEGTILDVAELPPELHQNSLRHIAAFEDGRIAIAFQWQGDPYAAPSITGLYTPGRGLKLLHMTDGVLRGLDGYAGSVAVLDPSHFAVTFPRGGLLQTFNTQGHATVSLRQTDICGVAAAGGFGLATDGLGHVHALTDGTAHNLIRYDLAFDNHLIRIAV